MSPRRPVKPLAFKPMVPDVPPVAQVMSRRQSAIHSLMYRLRLSEACLETVRRVVPPAMASQLRAGGWDDEGWTVLVPNSAVSAKLRQWLPRLSEALAARGMKVNAIRVRIQQGGR